MRESTRGAVSVVIRTLVALACVAVVVFARVTTGWADLAVMLAALAGLLLLLARYNAKYR